MLSYCLKCGKNTESKYLKVVRTKNGRNEKSEMQLRQPWIYLLTVLVIHLLKINKEKSF